MYRIDHDQTRGPMQEISISQFKAKCLRLVERVRTSKSPLRITRHGRPIVDVVPITPAIGTDDWFGSMVGTMKITGDIVSPIIDTREIEALEDKE